jgi:hypothetical protein
MIRAICGSFVYICVVLSQALHARLSGFGSGLPGASCPFSCPANVDFDAGCIVPLFCL